jgi:hypothetical protein
MLRKRAIILRILRYSLLTTIHAAAPAHAQQAFNVEGGN